ncbi:hypothetical protein SAMD00019534_104300 [Acytostelium subglobosum LB1]|uniref:hypothetical protein n=1 Tax=Acytostelium subglobosum LB1 TaxID=1410327 RepID=UPI0006448F6B|nr:hypothetical protein SAMD00019534_104300 [Acytostelium subglobosum LB1]GAM27255.1 hypothetical protein SAMD00019534_104300 [Acytostelium subglobosum LB1]|eukprot:XP_012749722.1 hypothetical protein SAMD00019534_104300 [Acytostelium subglobosum LB1]
MTSHYYDVCSGIESALSLWLLMMGKIFATIAITLALASSAFAVCPTPDYHLWPQTCFQYTHAEPTFELRNAAIWAGVTLQNTASLAIITPVVDAAGTNSYTLTAGTYQLLSNGPVGESTCPGINYSFTVTANNPVVSYVSGCPSSTKSRIVISNPGSFTHIRIDGGAPIVISGASGLQSPGVHTIAYLQGSPSTVPSCWVYATVPTVTC